MILWHATFTLTDLRVKYMGGIYATRLATHFNVQIRQHDHPLPRAYLDRAAMEDHQFIVADY